MDHAINDLRERLNAEIELYRQGCYGTSKEVLQVYVDAMNVFELYEYGEKRTDLNKMHIDL